MTFDLSIKQCSAGPGHSEFVFARDLERTFVYVKDISDSFPLADGYGAILICYSNINTLYMFQSNKYPAQEPKLLLSGKDPEALSLEGAGMVIPLQSGSTKDAIAEFKGRLEEFRKLLTA